MKAVVLAAGVGSRLGKSIPKPLTPLVTGETILGRQIKKLTTVMDFDDIFIVVGFKKELIMETFPTVGYIYNDAFVTTNTSKSLLLALKKLRGNDVIWLNGDVVFDEPVIKSIAGFKGSCMAVNTASVDEEEVKYDIKNDGSIDKVSKTVEHALGEAVGINKVCAEHIPLLIDSLTKCNDNDYFERGIEYAIWTGMKIYPVDISKYGCIEVDFEQDLKTANSFL